MVARKVTDYRSDKRVKMRSRTCVTCSAEFIDITASRKVADVCPPCRVATGRFKWINCVECGVKYATSVEHNTQLVHACRQCSQRSAKVRRLMSSARKRRKAKPKPPAIRREPVALATIYPDAFLDICARLERAATPWEREPIQQEIDRWRTPLSPEQIERRRSEGLPITEASGS